jgi:hypothetical protein
MGTPTIPTVKSADLTVPMIITSSVSADRHVAASFSRGRSGGLGGVGGFGSPDPGGSHG